MKKNKNVVIISSSPRINGNSDVLCQQFRKGAESAGNKVTYINLANYNLGYCIGCYACSHTGKCYQNDGMNEISEALEKADVIVFGTPVYFYSMSGQLKVFIDRLVPMYTKVKADIYMIITAADEEVANLEATAEAIRGLTRDCFEGCDEKGVLLAPALTDRGEVLSHREYLSMALEMGANC